MPRTARVVVPGLPYHITQRGNYHHAVFLDEGDYRIYLSWMRQYALRYGVTFLAYCLMPNHVHFVLIPSKEKALAGLFCTTHMRYAQYVNNKIHEQGHLWQSRFYSCVMEGHHILAAIRYVERNPVRAGLVIEPWEWQWSSAAFHTGLKNQTPLQLEEVYEKIDVSREQWKDFISSEDTAETETIRKNTRTGRPAGSNMFIKGIEERLNRRLGLLPRGRPEKKMDK